MFELQYNKVFYSALPQKGQYLKSGFIPLPQLLHARL